MSLAAVAGQKFYIGGQMDDQADDFVAADFSSVSWTEVDGWSQAGEVGDTANLISTDLINRSRTVKQAGTDNAGSMQNVFAIIEDDPGQLALVAAKKTKKNYAFKIEGNDAATSPTSPAPKPTTRLFVGIVMSTSESGGSANTVQNLNATIEINSNIVKVAKNP